MKLRTLKDNVTAYNQPKGTILENVPEKQAKHLIKVGAVEVVKEQVKRARKAKGAE